LERSDRKIVIRSAVDYRGPVPGVGIHGRYGIDAGHNCARTLSELPRIAAQHVRRIELGDRPQSHSTDWAVATLTAFSSSNSLVTCSHPLLSLLVAMGALRSP